jgi:glycosyltransferase involved in cell wall biosynthesis
MTGSEAPLVSVGIPAFNGERFIGAAIESVLGQSYGRFELIIVDDRSSDGTADIIKGYSDPRIRVMANSSRLGQMGNWNKTLGEARGTLIKLLPQDDLLYPTCLERQVEAFAKPENQGVALVCCARDIIDPSGRVILRRSFRRRKGRLAGVRAVKESIRAGTNLIGEPAGVLFQSAAVDKVGLFDDRNFYVIDLDYWCRALLTGDLYIIPEPLCAFRVSGGSASLRVASSQDKDFRNFIRFLARDERFHLTGVDGFRGKIKAFANRRLRQLFYKMIVKEAR